MSIIQTSPLRPVFFAQAPNAIIPKKQTPGSAGYDLHALTDGALDPSERQLVDTGICVALPPTSLGLICPRSGPALHAGVTVLNGPGVADADYRLPLGILLINLGHSRFTWQAGSRLAQLVLLSLLPSVAQNDIHVATPEEWEQLTTNLTRSGGFGSTGGFNSSAVDVVPTSDS